MCYALFQAQCIVWSGLDPPSTGPVRIRSTSCMATPRAESAHGGRLGPGSQLKTRLQPPDLRTQDAAPENPRMAVLQTRKKRDPRSEDGGGPWVSTPRRRSESLPNGFKRSTASLGDAIVLLGIQHPLDLAPIDRCFQEPRLCAQRSVVWQTDWPPCAVEATGTKVGNSPRATPWRGCGMSTRGVDKLPKLVSSRGRRELAESWPRALAASGRTERARFAQTCPHVDFRAFLWPAEMAASQGAGTSSPEESLVVDVGCRRIASFDNRCYRAPSEWDAAGDVPATGNACGEGKSGAPDS